MISADDQKYCNRECCRWICMNCTGLDKATTKLLNQQKYSNIRFLCNVCDSPTLKYLHDKVPQLQKSQMSFENVKALGTCLNKNYDLLPVTMEMYDMLSNHDSKWKNKRHSQPAYSKLWQLSRFFIQVDQENKTGYFQSHICFHGQSRWITKSPGCRLI